ncbi:hypothetical protein [Actinomadura sp. 6N118]|uniref:hypothetical protein n=1 Tax=Actinomadura sp. 6N118 TaxID=3375151 RepID=UPI0037B3D3FC
MTAPVQRDEAWFAAASSEDRFRAYEAGELAMLLTTAPPTKTTATPPAGQLNEGALRTLAPERIVEAYEAGRLDFVLGRISGTAQVDQDADVSAL